MNDENFHTPLAQHTKTKKMTNENNTGAGKASTHTLPAWTEMEYTTTCKNPYLATPFFVPKEAKCFLCREDGTRKEQRMIFLVFKPTSAPADAEWEDDPVPGETWVMPLGDDDELIEPAKVIFLDQDPSSLVSVVEENDQTITFDLYWRHGEVRMEKAEKNEDGHFVCRKDDFGEDGLAVTFTPEEEEGQPFVVRLQIPYLGFSLYDAEGNKLHDEVEVAHDKVDDYSYDFVGDEVNDRFTLQLDGDKLVYTCVLRPGDGQLVVRNQRDRLAVVGQIPAEGKLADLLMGAHSALVKNRNNRWRIQLEGSSIAQEAEIEVSPATLVAFAREKMTKGVDIDQLGQQLMALEGKHAFQWFWLKEDDWSHDDPMFDMFMKQLCAFSFVSQKPIQGDVIAARNNKRKIRRCARLVKAHQAGETNLWEETEEQRQEILHLFSTYHQSFVEELEEEAV